MAYMVYQFEAISIQEYIMGSSKLKEMVGASQLLDTLTGKLLSVALEHAGLIECTLEAVERCHLQEGDVFFPRRAGGVFLAVMVQGDSANLFQRLWPLLVQQIAPGLKFSVANVVSEEIKQAIQSVRIKLNIEKNTPKVVLPEMSPLVMRSPRTGGAATTTQHGVSIDLATQVKRQTQDKAKALFIGIHNKWLPEGEHKTFPTVFDHTQKSAKVVEFPFSGHEGGHTVAIVHADGNGIGQYIQQFFHQIDQAHIGDIDFLKSYTTFSKGINSATQRAAKEAMKWLIAQSEKECDALPIRPLILSGDDMTCIIRDDYAFQFMERFTQAFETYSQEELNQIQVGREAFPTYLTLTTGMVFLRSNQPFYMGYQLAEDLCARSKAQARANKNRGGIIPSTLSFVHATSTLFDNANAFIQGELTTQNSLKLTHETYALGQDTSSVTPFLALKALCDCFCDETLNIRFMRKLATTLQLDTEHAKRMIQRWKEISNPSDIERLETLLKKYFQLSSLEALCSQNSPISDLIAYQQLNTGATPS